MIMQRRGFFGAVAALVAVVRGPRALDAGVGVIRNTFARNAAAIDALRIRVPVVARWPVRFDERTGLLVRNGPVLWATP